MIDYRVPPLSWATIGQIAWDWRSALGCHEAPYLPIVDILDKLLGNEPEFFEWHIEPKSYMGDAEGETCPQGTFIRIREDVYLAACRGEGRARFTLAHEFGHWVLHRNSSNRPLQRVMVRGTVKAYCLAEPQANAFAARFLMPHQYLRPGDTVEQIMQRFGVTKSAAENRLSDFRKEAR